ncbi:MAG: metallophosphoesterase [Archangium sp.]|nr:metallophosphoesterase [Archangium sp.]MDP3571810.1 metallophosphoesterase [Archangium sp.]
MRPAMLLWVLAAVACSRPTTPRAALATKLAVTLDAGDDPDAGTVRFIALGDTGKGNPGQFQVGAAMGTFCAAHGCDFVILLGDNFYPNGVGSTDDPQWKKAFVDPYASVEAPFYAVLGNHDCGGDGAGTDLPRGDVQVAYSEVNPKWRMPGRHYKWSIGEVDFFVADTNRSMFSVDEDVRADFEKWLPASKATWKIAFAHHPYLSNGEHGNAGSYDGLPFVPVANGASVKSFLDDRVCGQADFLFTGHDHSIQWLEPTCDGTELIVSGGGAKTTRLLGKQPAHYQSRNLGFVYVIIRGNTLTASFHDADGVQQYTRTVLK